MDAAIFGLIVADLIAEPMDLRHPPAAGGLALVNSVQLTTGGNVCNTGVAMAKLGMTVAAAGLVGRDVLGSAVAERLRSAGVDTSAVFTTDQAQTSASVVAVEPTGERCFFHTPGATALLDAAAFRRCFETFTRCKFVQIGYFGLLPALTPDLPDLLRELRSAAPGTKVALDTVNPPAGSGAAGADPAAPGPVRPQPHRGRRPDGRSRPRPDGGRLPPAHEDRADRHQAGRRGLLPRRRRRGREVPAAPVAVVDTTGAGDTWFGGLLTGLIRGMPLEQAGRFANRAAADCCTAFGASAGVKSFEQTLARM